MKKFTHLFAGRKSPLQAIEQQANDWMRKIASQQMTHADGESFRRWIKLDPAHGDAFAEARKRWEQLGEAATLVAARAGMSTFATAEKSASKTWTRRAFLGTAFVGTAATAATVIVRPPMGLWPSVNELQADYRTTIGGHQSVSLASGVEIELSTRTSVSVLSDRAGITGIDLISGQTAVNLGERQAPFLVKAGDISAYASVGEFEVRRVQEKVRVTCLRGNVSLRKGAREMTLSARQQVTCDADGLGSISQADPAQVSAWREGTLRFADAPLIDVIEEINRYRPGHIAILDQDIAAKPVTGRFRINALDKAVDQIQLALGLRCRMLPGGLVLLSK